MIKLNAAEAKAYDNRGGFINEAGKYVGKFESVIWHESDNGKGKSENIILNFISESKEKARFYVNLSYWGGTPNERGSQSIQAILACLRLRDSGDTTPTILKEWSKDAQGEIDVQRQVFLNMSNKPIGIVVQMVHDDGQEKPSANLYSVFEPSSEMVASEILDQAIQPVKLAKVMEYIANKPLVDKRKNHNKNQLPPAAPRRMAPPSKPDVDDLDDSIPF